MEETIMEEREETMVSPFGGNPFIRTAHFLKPISKNSQPLSPLSKFLIFDVRETPLKVCFRETRWPHDRWKDWVYKLLPKYQDIWKSAGIYDSILNSTFNIIKHNDLILALAEKWCVETNTFVFLWGESTITLEDMIILGGHSVLGGYVMSPINTIEMTRTEEKLTKTRRNIELSAGRYLTHLAWMDNFIDSDDELTHVAFLSLWLSKYVFSTGHGGVETNVFSVAIHLSIGTRLAIAPAVLAMLYRDLSLIKNSIVSFSKGSSLKSKGVSNTINIWGPIHLVQMWAWERFPTLRPNPNSISFGEPRSARWHDKMQVKVDDLREALNSAGEDFHWRPYCMVVNNLKFNEFNRTIGELITVESGMDEKKELFALCIRPSELIGFGGFLEQYMPHRVAMQFGIDQDIPGFVSRLETPNSAWRYFKRPIEDKKLYIPSHLFESDVTLRYRAWWDPTVLSKEDKVTESNVDKVHLKSDNQGSQELDEDNNDCVPLDENDPTIMELLKFSKTNSAIVGEGVAREDKCSMANSFFKNVLPSTLETGACEGKEIVADPIDASSVVEYGQKANTSESNAINDKNDFPSWYEPLRPHMNLEDRISRLERLVIMCKAKIRGHNV